RNHPRHQPADGEESRAENPAQAQRSEPHARSRQGPRAAHSRRLTTLRDGAVSLRYRGGRMLATWLAAMLVHGAAVAAPQAASRDARPARWTHPVGDHGGDRGALDRILVDIVHGLPGPPRRPGHWAPPPAGVSRAGALAR